MANARRIALRVLVRVEKDSAFANRALDAALAEAGPLDPRDAALATELTYGTLRRQVTIDHALAHFSRRGLASLDAQTRALLRLGAHQLLHLRVPERAAVHETVELAKEIEHGRPVSYVNAVLRALARERAHILVPPASVDPAGFLSLTESFPRWLTERLVTDLGFEAAAALLASLNHPAPLELRVNLRRHDRAAATAALKADFGLDALPTRWSPSGLAVSEAKTSAALLRPEGGGWQAQDEGAQLVSYFAGPVAGQVVLDACAAPGGKACHLAELMDDRGRIDALDVHGSRVREIVEGARKLGLSSVTARAADATAPLTGTPPDGYDLAVVDAPCTGLGTIRRHPELKSRRAPEDIARLAALQASLLDNVAGYVKRGGVLVYAVCTFTREEGTDQVDAFLRRHPDFARARPPEGAVPWEALLDARGDLSIDPARHGTDAFLAARLQRR